MIRSLLVALLLAGAAAAQTADPMLSPPAPPANLSPEGQAIFQRMQSIPTGKPVESADAYTPIEAVTGAARRRSLPRAAPRSVGLDPFALEKAQAWANEQESFALLVARRGKLVHERYAEGFTPESRFATASMHKAVLALAYGRAIADGKISLDDPLSKHLGEYKDHPTGQITIRQLLDMTSGLVPPGGEGYGPDSAGMALMFAQDLRRTTQRFVQGPAPGTAFGYANVSTQLAGHALEAALGERYSGWLSRTFWAPLGAGTANLWLDREGGNPHYFCCLQATPRDWLLVGELMRSKGRAGSTRVLPEGWLDTVIAPSARNPNFGMNIWRGSPHDPARSYGPGIAMKVPAKEPFAREDVYYIDGAGGQRVYVVPSEELTIIRIGKPSATWDDSALVNLVLAGIRK